jgi:hypothetical protein
MRIRRHTKQFTAWLACIAILLAALAPSISHALPAASGTNSFWAEICSSTGPKMMKMAKGHGSNSSSPAEKGMHFEQCPFCLAHAGSFGLPPSPGFTFPVVNGTFELPPLLYRSPRPLFMWAAPQSHAPPALT